MRRPALPLAIRSLLCLPALIQCVCYFPSGRIAPQDTPCRSDTEESACCGEGYACLSNNICMSTGNELQEKGSTIYVRGSCTDKSWRSGNCPNFCADPKIANAAGGNGIGKCEGRDDKVFYCIDLQTHDCEKNKNILFFNEAPTVLTTIGVVAATSVPESSLATKKASSTAEEGGTSAAAQTTVVSGVPTVIDESSPATESPSATPAPAKQSNTVPIAAGVGGGVGGVAVICAGVAFFFWKRSRQAKKVTAESTLTYHPHALAPPPPPPMGTYHHETWKPQAPPQYYEVAAPDNRQSRPYELPGNAF